MLPGLQFNKRRHICAAWVVRIVVMIACLGLTSKTAIADNLQLVSHAGKHVSIGAR
jgi:hypothetical protein